VLARPWNSPRFRLGSSSSKLAIFRRGVRAIPVGVIEISDQQTRFVPITDRKKLTGAVLAGIAIGMWLGWRRRR